MTRQRIGLIGTSGHAERVVAAALAAVEEVQFWGVLSRTPSRAAEFAARHGVHRAYSSLDELVNDPELDAVWIATPNNLHLPVGLACIEAGKHVLIEKPMATTEPDACKILEAARRHRVTVHVGFHQRFRPAHRQLADLVHRGDLGSIGFIRLHHFYRYASAPSAWRSSRSESGGWAINDVGSHLLDLLLWITGLPAQVRSATFATQRFAVETDDTAAILLGIGDKGVAVVATSTALDGSKSRIEIYGSTGWARAEGTWPGGGTVETSLGDRIEFESTSPTEPFEAQLKDFVAAIGGDPSIGADVASGVENVHLIEEALALARNP